VPSTCHPLIDGAFVDWVVKCKFVLLMQSQAGDCRDRFRTRADFKQRFSTVVLIGVLLSGGQDGDVTIPTKGTISTKGQKTKGATHEWHCSTSRTGTVA
jgi:hypothetical protein